ncbi:MAG: hypothetical protein K8R31_14175 [Bacteroidales bacterium]|nr:hypothetical protein [Bacteroidales bacterium]
MKNLFRVLFLVMISMSLLITTGCEEDDIVDEMVGTWVLHEGELTVQGATVTLTPSEMEINISVIFTANAFTATITETGESPDIETGTWVRTSSTTIVITAPGEDPVTLIKEGEYYTQTETEDGMTMKMKFRKL